VRLVRSRPVFGKGRRATKRLVHEGVRTPAEVLEVKLGRFVSNTNSGVGGSMEKLQAKRTLKVRVEPPGAAAYDVTLRLDRSDPLVPVAGGVRTEVLVDPEDRTKVALVPDAVFTLPGGGTWQPESDLTRLAESGDVEGLTRALQDRVQKDEDD